jgi:hypothetical protein
MVIMSKLDNGVYQDDPVFSNVTSGEHFITINEKKGTCDPSLNYNGFYQVFYTK